MMASCIRNHQRQHSQSRMRILTWMINFMAVATFMPGLAHAVNVNVENGRFLEVAHADELDFKDEATVEAWITPKGMVGVGDARIVDKSQAMNEARGGFYLALGKGNTPVFYSAAGDLRSKDAAPQNKPAH